MMMCCSLRLFLPEVILFVNVRVQAITVTILPKRIKGTHVENGISGIP